MDSDHAEEAASASLRAATKLKSEGQIAEAVEQLIQFRNYANSSRIVFGIESYLRLPAYLQAAGLRDQAWAEFYNLLTNGYPNQLNDRGVILCEKSVVYDKMRLFLQRDDNDLLAVHFGILSHGHLIAGLKQQDRIEELTRAQDLNWITEIITDLIGGTDRQDLIGPAIEIFKRFIGRNYNLKLLDEESRNIFSPTQ
jgi:hypothetical protein